MRFFFVKRVSPPAFFVGFFFFTPYHRTIIARLVFVVVRGVVFKRILLFFCDGHVVLFRTGISCIYSSKSAAWCLCRTNGSGRKERFLVLINNLHNITDFVSHRVIIPQIEKAIRVYDMI